MVTPIIPPAVDDNYHYNAGLLTQWCSQCDWKEGKLRQEVAACPECGAPVAKNCSLLFGGTRVRFRSGKNRFYLTPRYCGENFPRISYGVDESIVFENDFPDLVIFMLRHGNFWRNSNY